MTATTTTSRWDVNLAALRQYVAREGHARVPGSHIEHLDGEGDIRLGTWVTYVRQRYRAGRLTVAQAQTLAEFPEWTWGERRLTQSDALRARNSEIIVLRGEGWSLQKIADRYGMTRQRVHQIVDEVGL